MQINKLTSVFYAYVFLLKINFRHNVVKVCGTKSPAARGSTAILTML